MQVYYEIETDIPIDHQLHLQLPDTKYLCKINLT